MKKAASLMIALAFMTLLALISCGGSGNAPEADENVAEADVNAPEGGENTPSKTIEKWFNLLPDKQFDAMEKLCVYQDGTKLNKEDSTFLVDILVEWIMALEEPEGMKDFKIIVKEETVSEDGNTAMVKYQYVVGDAGKEVVDSLINIDGRWYILF